MSSTVYLALGSNLGDREKNILKAIAAIKNMEGFELLDNSAIYITDPVEMKTDAPDFFNIALKGEYKYTPNELLTNIEKIERDLGREKKGKYLPRTIDIDILLFGDSLIDSPKLTVPHKRLIKRPFMMVPLLEMEADLVIPGTDKRLDSYLKKRDIGKVIVYKELDPHNVRTELHRD